jgi:hypothetical protein
MSMRSGGKWIDQWGVAALAAVAGLAALVVFLRVAEPPERTPQTKFREDYSEQPLMDVLATNGFERRLADIAEAGKAAPGEREVGRQSGSPGFHRTEELILKTFRDAGLEAQTQELQVVVPHTDFCEVLDEKGEPPPGVTLYPFAPNGLIPLALPKEGVSGRLVRTESAELKYLTGHAPEDSIVLTYLASSGAWPLLASVGVRAMIVQEDDLEKQMRNDPNQPAPWRNAGVNADMPYPIFVARGPIAEFAGQRLTIRCKATWQSRPVRNLLGVLRGKQAREEALILTAFYDSASLVPDLAPGAEQSVAVAALLEYAKALAPYRDTLSRDVIFVATAGHAQSMAGVTRLMEAVDEFSRRRVTYRTFDQRRADEERMLGYAVRARTVLSDIEQLSPDGIPAYGIAWQRQDPGFRTWFEDNFKIVAGEVDLELKEKLLACRLDYLRAGSPVFREGFDASKAGDEERKAETNSHPLLATYLAANRAEGRAANLMALPFWQLPERGEFAEWTYASRMKRRLDRLEAHHRQQIRELGDTIAVAKLLLPYRRTLTLNLELNSGGKWAAVSSKTRDLSVLVGYNGAGMTVEPQVSGVARAIREKAPQIDGAKAFDVITWGPRDAEGSAERPNPHSGWLTELESEIWYSCGRLSYTVINCDYYPPKAGTPDDELADLPLDSLRVQIPALGRAILSMAYGRVPFKTISFDKKSALFTIHGRVFGSAGVTTMVAGHPMTENTFAWVYPTDRRDMALNLWHKMRLYPILRADPYGRYEKVLNTDFSVYETITAQGARFDDDGRVTFVKDASPAGQGVYKNEALPGGDAVATAQQEAKPINMALFRCAPVAAFDTGNPQTMKSFARVSFLSRMGLAGPQRSNTGRMTTFVDPDFSFYVGLLAGSAENEEIQTYRAFMCNVDPAEPIAPGEQEIYGRGYLAADTPNLAFAHMEASATMLRTAEKRLGLLQKHGMADEQMLGFHATAREWLNTAAEKKAQKDTVSAVNASATSLAYNINNHPAIRSRISQAIVGILWYLGLLVPFVFFTEKLLFGFPDIRKQLLAVAVIFLVAFVLLRLFHPAFEMVRSSLMILLGFVTLLLTLLVTMMVGGKFRQNLKGLRSKEGQVEGADINRGGVVGTAFMLGLNNMRRRKVRTGLTCVTLVLITFAMICFTSVSTDLVNVEYPTGRTPCNGIMLRNQNFVRLQPSEIDGIRRIYAERYPIMERQWVVARLDLWKGILRNAEILIDREYSIEGNKLRKRAKVSSALPMTWAEPMFSGLDKFLLTNRGWFPRPPSTREERFTAAREGYKAKSLVILPDVVAKDLAITVDDVNTTNVIVNIRGEDYEVQGIIDSVELSKTAGLDGQSILPYDINTIQNLGQSSGGGALIPEDVGRLTGAQVILVNREPVLKDEETITVSCSVLFPREPYQLGRNTPTLPPVEYRDQRRLVLEFLERLGEPAYYGIDGIAYYGSRQRTKTIAGLLELLVPLLIAALTVFNTMRGSVYERKDEIYVYNAVGIAPNHVFFMFMAEACVYAVMGAMMGYLFSQGTGRALTALGLNGGLNMDYSSVETIYASLAIMGAVLLSTVIPARDAAKLASPAERRDWELPVAKGDRMEFNLPFTFTPHDRVAVVSYFHRWLDANGAGSSGPFYCAPPALDLKEPGAGGDEDLVPAISSTIWLKPYDLGVSQRMEISLDIDPETGEHIAHIVLERLSGHAAAWQRTVKPFLVALRKQFLNWRATTDAERGEMFVEAKGLLTGLAAQEAKHG